MVKRYQSRERDFLLESESDFLFSNKKSDSTASGCEMRRRHLSLQTNILLEIWDDFPLTTSKIGTHFLHEVYIMTWSSLHAMGTLICQNGDPILNEMGTQNMHIYTGWPLGFYRISTTPSQNGQLSTDFYFFNCSCLSCKNLC